MWSLALQADNFHDTCLVENVMAPAYALPESGIRHEGSQIGEPGVRVWPRQRIVCNSRSCRFTGGFPQHVGITGGSCKIAKLAAIFSACGRILEGRRHLMPSIRSISEISRNLRRSRGINVPESESTRTLAQLSTGALPVLQARWKQPGLLRRLFYPLS